MSKFFEPWRAVKVVPEASSFVPDDPVEKSRWEGAELRARRDAPTHIFGTGVWDPDVCRGLLSGQDVPTDDQGIVLVVNAVATKLGRVDTEALASHIVQCVNFCAGYNLAEMGVVSLDALIAWVEIETGEPSRELFNRLWPVREWKGDLDERARVAREQPEAEGASGEALPSADGNRGSNGAGVRGSGDKFDKDHDTALQKSRGRKRG